MGQATPAIGDSRSCCATLSGAPEPGAPRVILWLQGITLLWMVIECAVSLYAATTAHSVALLAFGADSFVELLSASVVLLPLFVSFPLAKERTARWAGVLLFGLAAIVAFTSVMALARSNQPETSWIGIGITIAALAIMPGLAWFKRRVARETDNRTLAADAVQSATCAYLAAVTLVGLGMNAALHIRWIDSVAALAAVPILLIEGRRAMRGEGCGCC